MIVLVCGGRDFEDREHLDTTLDAIHARTPISLVIHGGAKGADMMACEWAEANGVTYRRFLASWITDGKAAGPIRNARMLAEGKPDLVVAFPGGKGTTDMITKAQAKGVTVTIIEPRRFRIAKDPR